MTIEDLKNGVKIYDFNYQNVVWYTYLCVHPSGSGNYHILIDQNEDPLRVYHKRLQEILNKGFSSYRDAELGRAKFLEDTAKSLRQEDKVF